MLKAALANDIQLRVDADWSIDQVVQRRTLELGQVLARQVADEVGGGEDGLAVDRLHRIVKRMPESRDSSRVATPIGSGGSTGGVLLRTAPGRKSAVVRASPWNGVTTGR